MMLRDMIKRDYKSHKPITNIQRFCFLICNSTLRFSQCWTQQLREVD